MKARHKKMYFIIFAVAGLSAATLFLLNAFSNNIVYFYSPTEVLAGKAPTSSTFRVGGLVKEGSVQRSDNSLDISFTVTDKANDIQVSYQGVLPDLFREGQGVIAEGKLIDKQSFKAKQILAKHDENYMPPEVAAALKKSGSVSNTYPEK